MRITRRWAMPNSKTFTIKPIRELIEKYTSGYKSGENIIIDPF